MTPDQIERIRSTADIILGSGRFADRFYEALFAIAPETRSLFRDDLTALKLKFMNMLASIVGAVERPEMFASILTHLGRQHRRYGVKATHYEPVGTALLISLQASLGERMTPQVRDAWTCLYTEIEGAMLQGGALG